MQPDVVLMDEPCSALDPIATSRIEDLMHELKRDFTIVIVTHNMQQAARVSDRTAFFTTEVAEDSSRVGRLVEFDRTRHDLHPAPPTSAPRATSPVGSDEPDATRMAGGTTGDGSEPGGSGPGQPKSGSSSVRRCDGDLADAVIVVDTDGVEAASATTGRGTRSGTAVTATRWPRSRSTSC